MCMRKSIKVGRLKPVKGFFTNSCDILLNEQPICTSVFVMFIVLKLFRPTVTEVRVTAGRE